MWINKGNKIYLWVKSNSVSCGLYKKASRFEKVILCNFFNFYNSNIKLVDPLITRISCSNSFENIQVPFQFKIITSFFGPYFSLSSGKV